MHCKKYTGILKFALWEILVYNYANIFTNYFGGFMKKILFAVLACTLLSGAVFSKGGNDKADEPPKELVVWSAASEDEAQALVAAFTKLHPEISTSIIRAGSGELLTRLNAEQPRPSGDVLMGIARESFDMAYELFRPYKTANHANIGENVRDPVAVPKYYGFSMPLQALMVNTNLLKPEDYPKTWKDLINPKYKGEIVLANPTLSGSAYAQLYMWYKFYGEDFVRTIAQTVVFNTSSTAGPEAVARGEYAITATGEANIAKYMEKGNPVTFVYPSDGTGARFDASGIIDHGPNPKAAELFMDFLTSKEAYQIIYDTRGRRVVIDGIPGPKHLPSLDKIKLVEYNAKEAADMREELTSKFSDMMK